MTLDELYNVTWEQLLDIYKGAIDHQINFAIPLKYQAEPKGIFDYMTKPLNKLAESADEKTEKDSKKEFAEKFAEMKKQYKAGSKLTPDVAAQIKRLSSDASLKSV